MSDDKGIHGKDRQGNGWPRPYRSGNNRAWSGWLLHVEWDVIDFHLRLGFTSIYSFMTNKRGAVACSSLFTDLKNRGLIDGKPSNYFVTDLGHELYIMTDQFLLEAPCEEDEDSEAVA